MVDNETAKTVLQFGKDVAEDVVRPTSKSIGNNLGLLVDGVMGWLGYWGQKQVIKREAYLADYKKKINEKVAAIPDEKLQEPEIRIVGPAIEASKFYIEEESFREMFADLVASSCHSDYANKVHPAFPEFIKQLSYMDIKLLTLFQQTHTLPCCECYAQGQDNLVTPFPQLLFDFKDCSHDFSQSDELKLTQTIENLSRLGLLVKNSKVIELGYDYEKFRTHWFYSIIIKKVPEDRKMHIRKYRIELTQLGSDFVQCCFGN